MSVSTECGRTSGCSSIHSDGQSWVLRLRTLARSNSTLGSIKFAGQLFSPVYASLSVLSDSMVSLFACTCSHSGLNI